MCSRRRDHCSAHGTPIRHRSPSPCTDQGVANRQEERDKLFRHCQRRSSYSSTSASSPAPRGFTASRRTRARHQQQVEEGGSSTTMEDALRSTAFAPRERRGTRFPTRSRGGPHRRGAPAGGGEGAAPLLRLSPALLRPRGQGKSPTTVAHRREEGRGQCRREEGRRRADAIEIATGTYAVRATFASTFASRMLEMRHFASQTRLLYAQQNM
jgi:hypothetical protein